MSHWKNIFQDYKGLFFSNNADFSPTLIKEITKQTKIKEIKELTNLYIPDMSGLRNLSK